MATSGLPPCAPAFPAADGSSVLAEGTIKAWVPTDGDDPALWRVTTTMVTRKIWKSLR